MAGVEGADTAVPEPVGAARDVLESAMFPGAMPKTEHEKMLAGEPYLAGHPELVAARLRARLLLRAFTDAAPGDADGRHRSLAALLGAMGPGGWIEPPFRCDYGAQIRLGARSYANFDCVFLDCAPIEIGDDVMLGPGVHLYTATHPIDPDERASGLELARPIRIGAKAWLGGRTIVGPGVSIGAGTTVGAGSVVTRDLPARVVAAGNPCRVLRELP